MPRKSNDTVAVLGIDIGKNVFHFIGLNKRGTIVLRQKLSRDSQLLLEGLRAGHYRVEVRAFTNDLMASEPFVIDFTVTRAPVHATDRARLDRITLHATSPAAFHAYDLMRTAQFYP